MGTIKSVTSENLTEYVADKRVLGRPIASPAEAAAAEVNAAAAAAAAAAKVESKSDEKAEAKGEEKEAKKEEKSPVVATGTETVSTAPEPQGDPKQKPKNPVQPRIDELTREKRELEEFAEGEYSARVEAQRRISELEAQIKSLQPKADAPKEEPEPDPTKYEDQKAFLKEWGEWHEKKVLARVTADTEKKARDAEIARLVKEADERREASLIQARKDYQDFDEVIRNASRAVEMKRIPAPPTHVERILAESENHAQVLYYFAKNPDEAKRIFGLRPAQAALAIGRLESTLVKGEVKPEAKAESVTTKTEAAPVTTTPPVTKAPPPMPSLNGAGAGDVAFDFSAPHKFKEYQRHRIAEIRRKHSAH